MNHSDMRFICIHNVDLEIACGLCDRENKSSRFAHWPQGVKTFLICTGAYCAFLAFLLYIANLS